MAGSGEKTSFFNNYVTPKCLIREKMGVADPASPLDVPDSVGEIDNRHSRRGDNNVIFLYVELEGSLTQVRIQLWINADALDITPAQGPDASDQCPVAGSNSSSSLSSSSLSSLSSLSSESSTACIETRNWCLVDQKDLTCESEFLSFRNLPPGHYKVTVPVLDGTGTVEVKESHTE